MKPEKLYLEIINNLCDGVYFVDVDRRIIFWNKAAEQITGYPAGEIEGKTCDSNILTHIDNTGRPLCLFGCPLHATLIDGIQRRDEVFLRHKEGHRIPVLINIFPFKEDGKIIGAIEIFTPNSPIVYEDNLIASLSDMAMNDSLTGLPNRRKIESYLEYKLLELQRFQNKFAVIFLDVDNFRAFNDNYGHELGDEVLKSVARTMQANLRKDDMFGRWGGEEFVGIFDIKNDYEATITAEKLRVLVEGSEVFCDGKNLSITASLGAAVSRNGDTVETMIKRADTLMYQSKRGGKNRVTAE